MICSSHIYACLQLKWRGLFTDYTSSMQKINKCPHPCLKVVKISGFIGSHIDTKFAMYLIENSLVLEKLIFDLQKVNDTLYCHTSLFLTFLKDIENYMFFLMHIYYTFTYYTHVLFKYFTIIYVLFTYFICIFQVLLVGLYVFKKFVE